MKKTLLGAVMENRQTVDKPYSRELLRRFDRLTMGLSSLNQMTRIQSRLDVQAFVKEHGEDVCKAMFEELRAKDAEKQSAK